MNDDTDPDDDLEDISLQEEWVTKNCSPSKLWSLTFDIDDGTAVKEEVERAMEYYCYLWEKRQAPPYELSKLMVTIFRKYLRGKKSNRTLVAAFGFTGKQGGVGNNNQRDLDIATDIARLVLADKKLDFCLDSATSLGRTVTEKIWKEHKSRAVGQVRMELQAKGKDFTDKQEAIALKALKKETKLMRSIIKNSVNNLFQPSIPIPILVCNVS